MGERSSKFLLLMWKNWTLLKRHPIVTAFEVLFPVLLSLILVAIRNSVETNGENEMIYKPFDAESLFNIACTNSSFPIVAYSPKSEFLGRVMRNVCKDSTIIEYENSIELKEKIDGYEEDFSAAFEFDDSFNVISQVSQITDNVNVTIRLPSESYDGSRQQWHTELLYPILQTPGPRAGDKYTVDPDYARTGFLFFQQAITMAIIHDGQYIAPSPKIVLNRFPYPKWLNDPFYVGTLAGVVSMLMMCSFMCSYVNTIRAITIEKEKQLKELMKIMGLPGWLHWLAWFLRTFIILLVAVVMVVVVLKFDFKTIPVLPASDWSVLVVFFLLYSCSMITFCFFVSVFFSKANTAAAVGSFVALLTYLPYFLRRQISEIIPLSTALASSLFVNSGLSYGLWLILKFESIEEGVHWNNLWATASQDDDLTVGSIMLMLLFDTIFYLILALYVEAVLPGNFGVARPWYFPISKAFWCKEVPLDFEIQKARVADKEKYFERVADNRTVGIRLKNLTKQYDGSYAVKNLNLSMYEGHITVLLGHNGAGKTTTMSMITGMFPPSHGTVLVNGFDVKTNPDLVRASMGLCLQHNVLFDNLTVSEHLHFYAKLKGLSNDQINEEIDTYIKHLELEDKRDARSSTLSGGMKRKLSVAIALCGKSKVVVLDEPTAGMDATARRTVWNLLQEEKKGRTILLTTHFMDEADLLGDRIAIMAEGELQCCGSSFFLKQNYGTGYYLIMETTPKCQPERVTNLLRKHIPFIEVHSYVGAELTYQLCGNESEKFEAMLYDLENNISNLGLQSYGVSLTTLEEVFMKVGSSDENKNSEIYNGTIEIPCHDLQLNYLEGFSLVLNQIIAMTLKKFLSYLRTWHLLLLEIFLPTLLLITVILNSRGFFDSESTFPSLQLALRSYSGSITVVSGNQNIYYKNYINSLERDGQMFLEVQNVTKAMLQKTAEYPAHVKAHHHVGASFNDDTIVAWFNGDPYHAVPLSFALVLNTFFEKSLNKSITFSNHPLPLSLTTQLDDVQFDIIGFQMAAALGFGMIFLAGFFILPCIKERSSKAKHLQFISGVKVWVYWGTTFVCDLAIFLLAMGAVLVALALLQEDGFATTEELYRVALVLVSYCVNVLPLVYLTSYLSSTPSTGFSKIILLGTVTGIVGLSVMQMLEIPVLGLTNVGKQIHQILLFIPFYSVAKAIYDLKIIYTYRTICSMYGNFENACRYTDVCCGVDDYYSMESPGIGCNILIFFVMSFVLFVVLILIEDGIVSTIVYNITHRKKPPVAMTSVDSDVAEESNKIRTTSNGMLNREYSLVLRDVTKHYKNLPAVNGLSLGVKPYECFGLLGVNGAGKTTTFKLMTGDEKFSFGDAWVNGFSIRKEWNTVKKLIGYCPQFDALLEDLTVRETIKIFALIQGVSFKNCKLLQENLAHQFDFFEHIDKKIKDLSGGNKRKVSTALALIGDPPVVYLDEPSTGMDPSTKYYLWAALKKLRSSGKCIVLTSHSMEECEALCTRIAIMVNGNFQCLGSIQRLKNRFAEGFALTIKVKNCGEASSLDEEVKKVDDFIRTSFPGAELKERYQELLSYNVVKSSISWSKMFGILERSKRELNIDDYSLGQCSLEQVFLSFTKFQQ